MNKIERKYIEDKLDQIEELVKNMPTIEPVPGKRAVAVKGTLIRNVK